MKPPSPFPAAAGLAAGARGSGGGGPGAPGRAGGGGEPAPLVCPAVTAPGAASASRGPWGRPRRMRICPSILSADFSRLREEIGTRREAIHRRLEGLLRSSRLADAFQDQIYTLRGRRYVLPVKADFKGHLPGIVHDVAASGATLFMEPQSVVNDTNALASVIKAKPEALQSAVLPLTKKEHK